MYLHFYPPVVTEEIEGHYYRYDGYETAACRAFKILRRTPCGVWIKVGDYSKDKFILDDARRRWAYPTMKLALNSFRIRKERQIRHCNNTIQNANAALVAVGLQPIDPASRFFNEGDILEGF